MPGSTRRAFVRAALLAVIGGATVPATALAAIPKPRRVVPSRLRPLGRWSLPARRIEVVRGGSIDVELMFRPDINVDAPILRWWIPRWSCRPDEPTCNSNVLGPFERMDDPPLNSGLQSPITIPIELPPIIPAPPNAVLQGPQRGPPCARRTPSTCRRSYRVSCDIIDPVSRRHAIYSFPITVLDPGAVPPD